MWSLWVTVHSANLFCNLRPPVSSRLKAAQAVISLVEPTHFHGVFNFFFTSPALTVLELTIVWLAPISPGEIWHFKGLLKRRRQKDVKKIPFYWQDHQRPSVLKAERESEWRSQSWYQWAGKKSELGEWESVEGKREKRRSEKQWKYLAPCCLSIHAFLIVCLTFAAASHGKSVDTYWACIPVKFWSKPLKEWSPMKNVRTKW